MEGAGRLAFGGLLLKLPVVEAPFVGWFGWCTSYWLFGWSGDCISNAGLVWWYGSEVLATALTMPWLGVHIRSASLASSFWYVRSFCIRILLMFSGSCSRNSHTKMTFVSASPSIVSILLISVEGFSPLSARFFSLVLRSMAARWWRFGWNYCKSFCFRISFGPYGGLAMMSMRYWAAFWSMEAKTWWYLVVSLVIPWSANCDSAYWKQKAASCVQ